MNTMTIKHLMIIVCLQGLLGFQQAYAATYYVSPSGLDTNNGTSLTTPVKTIKRALSKASVSGDIVYARAGTYSETVTINQNGITLSAYQTEKPIIDGGTSLPSTDWGALITINGNKNTVFGFEVRNSNINGAHLGGYGIQVVGANNTVSRMNIHHTWQDGVIVNGDYGIVQDSTVWQASRAYMNTTVSSGWGSGLSAARNTSSSAIKKGIASYPVLQRNTVYNNWGEGISCFEADHCTLQDNISYDNWTINLYLSDATNSVVQRNIIYVSSNPAIPTRNNSHPGLLLADEVSTVPRSTNNLIVNNFIYNADLNVFSWTGVANSGLNNSLIAYNTIVNGGLLTGAGGNPAVVNVGSQIRNNIVSGSNSSVPSNTGITFSNNNWAVTPPSAAKSTSDIIGNPQIAKTGATTAGNLTSAYFKILATSPAIHAAVPLASVTQDFFLTPRSTSTPDMGGHELVTSTTTTTGTGTTTTGTGTTTTGTGTTTTGTGTTTTGTGTTTTGTGTTTTGTGTTTTTGTGTTTTGTGTTTTGTGTTTTTGTGTTTTGTGTTTTGTGTTTTGTTYYVSSTGTNSNSGKSLSTPVQTITAALNKAVTGDVIYVLTGTYSEALTIGQNGITLSAYPNNAPIIDGGTTLPNVDWSALITVNGNNNTVSGFEIRNSNINGAHLGGYGIQIVGAYNTVSNINVHHTWQQGIILNGDYGIVQDSTIWQASRAYVNTTISSGWGTGLSAARNTSATAIKSGITSYAILRRNTAYNNWGEGISCYQADHCTMEDNISYDNWTINMYLSDATNSLMQRNIIYVSSAPAIPTRNNTRPGILLADEVATAPRSANNTIINNFVYNTDIAAFSWTGVNNSGLNNDLIAYNTIVDGGLITGSGGSPTVVNVSSQIRNNIIVDSGGNSSVASSSGITFSNNNWTVAPPAAAKSSSDVIANPLIARTGTTAPSTLTSAYFKIPATSPVVNAAMPLPSVAQDFFLTPRNTTTPDIGGHEMH
jgi:parallel beta-helix repeat protein